MARPLPAQHRKPPLLPCLPGHPLRCAVILFVLLGAFAATARADVPPPPTPLRVGIYLSPPFVEGRNGNYTGFAVELWGEIAEKAGLQFQYQPFGTVPALLEAVQAHAVDVAVTNLTVTADRLGRVDFTVPYMSSGLRLMINEDRRGGFWQVIDRLRTGGHLRVYGLVLAGIVAGTIVLTLLDRRFDEDFSPNWFKGLSESFYHVMAVVTTGTSSHKPLFGAWGRAMAAVWLACGVALVAYVTSSITSVMTANALTAQINSIADLGHKRVGAIAGSVGAEFARGKGFNLQVFPTLDATIDALLRGRVDCVVADAPSLEAYDSQHPELPVTEVGELFRPEQFAFALPLGSPLGRTVSLQILSAGESGYLEQLRTKYFATAP